MGQILSGRGTKYRRLTICSTDETDFTSPPSALLCYEPEENASLVAGFMIYHIHL